MTLITPNIPEAEILTKTKIRTIGMIFTGKIIKLGQNVLIKGGHLTDFVFDVI